MKTSLLLKTAFFALATTALYAGSTDSKTMAGPTVNDVTIPISQELELNSSYSGRSNLRQGSAKIGSISTFESEASYVLSPQVTDSILLRVGGDAQNWSFDSHGPVLNTLRSYNGIIGTDLTLNDKIIMRVEAHPGLYGDNHLSSDDLMVPVQIGGTYLYSKNLQFILGFQINLDSSVPFIGAPGIRWQFADKWVLSAIPPKPQLQYLYNKNLTLYTGAEITGGTFRVAKNFGDAHGYGATSNHTLDSAVLDYTEIRYGVGLTYKVFRGVSLDVSGGWAPYRDFDYNRAKISFHDFGGAPYAAIGLKGSF